MATNVVPKKGKKKKEAKTLSLQEFLGDNATLVVKQTKSSWADETENQSDEEPTVMFNRPALPTAPRAARAANIDLSKIPSEGPFTAYVGNLPFDVSDEDIVKFFGNLKITNIRMQKDMAGRQRNFGYVEFETKQMLVEALAQDEANLKNKNVKVDLVEQNRDGGGHRDYGSSRHKEEGEDDKTLGDWRKKDSSASSKYPTKSYSSDKRYENDKGQDNQSDRYSGGFRNRTDKYDSPDGGFNKRNNFNDRNGSNKYGSLGRNSEERGRPKGSDLNEKQDGRNADSDTWRRKDVNANDRDGRPPIDNYSRRDNYNASDSGFRGFRDDRRDNSRDGNRDRQRDAFRNDKDGYRGNESYRGREENRSRNREDGNQWRRSDGSKKEGNWRNDQEGWRDDGRNRDRSREEDQDREEERHRFADVRGSTEKNREDGNDIKYGSAYLEKDRETCGLKEVCKDNERDVQNKEDGAVLVKEKDRVGDESEHVEEKRKDDSGDEGRGGVSKSIEDKGMNYGREEENRRGYRREEEKETEVSRREDNSKNIGRDQDNREERSRDDDRRRENLKDGEDRRDFRREDDNRRDNKRDEDSRWDNNRNVDNRKDFNRQEDYRNDYKREDDNRRDNRRDGDNRRDVRREDDYDNNRDGDNRRNYRRDGDGGRDYRKEDNRGRDGERGQEFRKEWNKGREEPKEVKERPRLNLMPRTKPIEEGAQTGGAVSSIFGGAKPVDTTQREREIEKKLKQNRSEDGRSDEIPKRNMTSRKESIEKLRDQPISLYPQRTSVSSETRSNIDTRESVGSVEPEESTSEKPINPPTKMVPAPPPKENIWEKRKTSQVPSKSPVTTDDEKKSNSVTSETNSDDSKTKMDLNLQNTESTVSESREPPVSRENIWDIKRKELINKQSTPASETKRTTVSANTVMPSKENLKNKSDRGFRETGVERGEGRKVEVSVKPKYKERPLPKSIDEMPKLEDKRIKDWNDKNKFNSLMDDDAISNDSNDDADDEISNNIASHQTIHQELTDCNIKS